MKIGQPFNPRGYFHFLMVPDPIAKFKKLRPLDKLVYGKLAEYLGRGHLNCWPSQRRLAEDLGVFPAAINASLKRLEREDMIRKVAPEGLDKLRHKTSRYELLWHPILQEELARTSGIAPSITPVFGETERRCSADQNPNEGEVEEREIKERDSKSKSQLSPEQKQTKAQHRKMRKRWMGEVLEYHNEAFAVDGKPRRWTVTPETEKKLNALFEHKFSVEDLKTAICNLSKSEWNRGANDRKTEYIDPTYLYRSIARVDKWLNTKEGKGEKKSRNSYQDAPKDTRDLPPPPVVDVDDPESVDKAMEKMGQAGRGRGRR